MVSESLHLRLFGHQNPLIVFLVPNDHASSGLPIKQGLSLLNYLTDTCRVYLSAREEPSLKDLTVSCWVWVSRQAGRRHSAMG